MSVIPGAFIVIEGSDGSGKATQFKLLAERLRAVGYDIVTFDFPRYDEASSHFVRQYLNGSYGPAAELSPYSASIFYALDRFEAAPMIRKALDDGKVVLSNRYVGSNMAHQGSKFTNEAEQRGYFLWADSLEYQLLSIPRPSINLFLRLPAATSKKLLDARASKSGAKLDEHEANIDHLERAVATYDTLCRLFPKDFKAIDCAPDGALLSIPEINDMLWQKIKPVLPEKPTLTARSSVVKLNENLPVPGARKPQPTRVEQEKQSLSILATTKLAERLDQSVKLDKFIKFDGSQKSYYQPPMKPETEEIFVDFMKVLADKREKIRDKLIGGGYANTGETIALLLPASSLISMDVAITNAEKQLATSDLEELRKLAGHEPKDKQVTANNVKWENLAELDFKETISTDLSALSMLEAMPRNEFAILSENFYSITDLPRTKVQADIEKWDYERKYQALQAVLANYDAALMSEIRYKWDVIAEQGLLLELIFSGLAVGFRTQPVTPRYGYEIPDTITKAGLEDDYIECFDLSLDVFSRLQSKNQEQSAAYATLNGHKIRFQLNTSLKNLADPPTQSSELFKKFYGQLLQSVVEYHPIVGNILLKKREANTQTPKKLKSGRPRHRRAR